MPEASNDPRPLRPWADPRYWKTVNGGQWDDPKSAIICYVNLMGTAQPTFGLRDNNYQMWRVTFDMPEGEGVNRKYKFEFERGGVTDYIGWQEAVNRFGLAANRCWNPWLSQYAGGEVIVYTQLYPGMPDKQPEAE